MRAGKKLLLSRTTAEAVTSFRTGTFNALETLDRSSKCGRLLLRRLLRLPSSKPTGTSSRAGLILMAHFTTTIPFASRIKSASCFGQTWPTKALTFSFLSEQGPTSTSQSKVSSLNGLNHLQGTPRVLHRPLSPLTWNRVTPIGQQSNHKPFANWRQVFTILVRCLCGR